MSRYKLRNVKGKRPKAWVGAAISAIGAIGSAIGNAYSASAQEEAARIQADAMLKANELSIQHQKEMIDFQKRENKLNRQIMQSAAMNEQLQAGEQNIIARKQASRIQLRNGGNRHSSYFLRGRNIPFRVVDGGTVIPIGVTEEGYNLYEILGDNHNQSHKTKGGSRKTGVGIKFPDGSVVEGEGNGNTDRGELLMTTPNGAEFISKHTINGFNPRDAVYKGMSPVDAYNMQETLKYTTPVKEMNRRELKRGGRCRAYNGRGWGYLSNPFLDMYSKFSNNPQRIDYIPYSEDYSTITMPDRPDIRVPKDIYAKPTWYEGLEDYEKNAVRGTMGQVGANLAGSVISGIGNLVSSRISQKANNYAANTLSNAYKSLKYIDPSIISRSDFAAPHAMAALQAPIVNSAAERAAAERSAQRAIRAIRKGTLSSAAAQSKLANINAGYNEAIGQISSNDEKIRQNIIEGNMQRLTQISNENANRDAQASQAYMSAYLDLLGRKNEMENTITMGLGETEANRLTGNAAIKTNAIGSTIGGFTNALNSSASAINQTLGGISTGRQNLRYAMLGSNQDNRVNYLLSANPNNPDNISQARQIANSIRAALKDGKSNPTLEARLQLLTSMYNV